MNPAKTDEPIETSFARRLAWVQKHLLETGPNLGKGIFEDAEKPLHIRRYGVVRRGIRTRVRPLQRSVRQLRCGVSLPIL